MIKTFKCPDTAALFANVPVPRFANIERPARRKLWMLNTASSLSDLAALRGNNLKKLARDRAGQWSIRINDRYRICFVWRGRDAYNVEIVDYH